MEIHSDRKYLDDYEVYDMLLDAIVTQIYHL